MSGDEKAAESKTPANDGASNPTLVELAQAVIEAEGVEQTAKVARQAAAQALATMAGEQAMSGYLPATPPVPHPEPVQTADTVTVTPVGRSAKKIVRGAVIHRLGAFGVHEGVVRAAVKRGRFERSEIVPALEAAGLKPATANAEFYMTGKYLRTRVHWKDSGDAHDMTLSPPDGWRVPKSLTDTEREALTA
jgi:hypothetical protein